MPGAPLRIVSLVPSVTETLLAWGIVPVACTRFCEQPELAHVGGTKDPDLAAIRALAPDLVVMDAEENRREDHAALADAGQSLHVLHVRDVADVGPELAPLADRLEVPYDPPPVRPPTEVRLRAFIPIWRRPYRALGTPTYGSSLLASLGVANVFADLEPYPEVTLEQASARHPDAVLAPDEPYPFGPRHLGELTAVGPVTLLDGKDLFWWGVRTTSALERLGRAIEPIAAR